MPDSIHDQNTTETLYRGWPNTRNTALVDHTTNDELIVTREFYNQADPTQKVYGIIRGIPGNLTLDCNTETNLFIIPGQEMTIPDYTPLYNNEIGYRNVKILYILENNRIQFVSGEVYQKGTERKCDLTTEKNRNLF